VADAEGAVNEDLYLQGIALDGMGQILKACLAGDDEAGKAQI
jgi:hypothetical protein